MTNVSTNRLNLRQDPKTEGRLQPHRPVLIDLHNVVKIYESAAGKYAALNGVNLRIYAGEFVAVIGKSGSGKTTLMNMITGIDRPTIGEVIVGGTPIHTLSEGATAVWRGNTIGVVFQFFQLLPTLTVIENVMLPMDFCHRYTLRERRQRALFLLDQVELVEYANRLPSALSGGQQQRVAIARALANDPPILIADEPTGNLDSGTAAAVFALFDKLVRQGKTIVMVTHDQDLVRQVLRTIYIKDGRITGDQSRASGPVDRAGSAGEDEYERPLQLLVSRILDDPQTATQRLREALKEIPKTREEREALYQAIYEEVKLRADQAEQAGDVTEARKLWGILVDATGK
jgi:putative ABC transport system ATP-binding protein